MSSPDLGSVEYDFDERKGSVMEYDGVPPGTYLCRVDEARPGTTRSGHTRWGLKYVVHAGPEVGRVAAWDGLTFSPKAAARTQQVLRALGLPHEGKVRLHADDLCGRVAFVTVEAGHYTNPSTGKTMRRNQVPYGGVTAADADSQGAAREDRESSSAELEDSSLPF